MRRLSFPLMFMVCTALSIPSLTGCDDKTPPPATEKKPIVEAKKLEPSKSESKMASVWSIDASSEATFVMTGKIETIKGTVKGAKGELQIDPSDLTLTRGEVAFDVTTLTTHTFDDEARDTKQTKDALVWLEVGEVTQAALRDEYKFATFAIRGIKSATPKDLTKAAGPKRTAKVTATGDFLLHGKKSEQTIDLEVELTFEGDKPKALSIKTASPFVVNLEGHEVHPRDNVGKLLASVTQLLQDKVAKESHVSLMLTAKPTGKEMDVKELKKMAAEDMKSSGGASAGSAGAAADDMQKEGMAGSGAGGGDSK